MKTLHLIRGVPGSGKSSFAHPLFHFPIASWHKQDHGSWNCFGHSHGGFQSSKGKMLDVGIDSSYNLYGNHRLFSESDIREYMQSQAVVATDHHRIIEKEST